MAGNFSFGAHRDFKVAYMKYLDNPDIGKIIINLSGVEYLDSSALGMLLLLRERTLAKNTNLFLSKPSGIVDRVFDLVGFPKLFTIN